jgi:hypothetical protein
MVMQFIVLICICILFVSVAARPWEVLPAGYVYQVGISALENAADIFVQASHALESLL